MIFGNIVKSQTTETLFLPLMEFQKLCNPKIPIADSVYTNFSGLPACLLMAGLRTVQLDLAYYQSFFIALDKGRLQLLKKVDKVPANEIDRAIKLKEKYFNEKQKK